MKLSTPSIFHAILYTFLLTCSHVALSAESTTPADIVHDFYSEYLKADAGNNDAIIKKYVSDQLMNSITDSTMCNYDSDDSVSASELEKNVHKNTSADNIKGTIFVTGTVFGLSLTSIISLSLKIHTPLGS